MHEKERVETRHLGSPERISVRQGPSLLSSHALSHQGPWEDPAQRLKLVPLLRPHARPLVVALVSIIGGSIANLLQPWPLKIVLDAVSGSKPLNGWLKHFVHSELG